MIDLIKMANDLQSTYSSRKYDQRGYSDREAYLSHSIVPSELIVFSGVGASLQTNKGELIDLSSMTVNCILGQNDPWVNANLIAYLLSGRPSFLTTRLGSDFYYKVAKRIIATTKMKDAVINHRQCNGTDVTELAVLAAFKHRKKGSYLLASFNNSYHGQGLTAYLMSGLQTDKRFLIHESPILFLHEPSNGSFATTVLTSHDKKIIHDIEKNASKIFAVIIEPIQVNNSVNTPSKTFFSELRATCSKHGIALIFDEVQTGFGWLGKMTAAERIGSWPNLLALSKAITSGNGPLSVLVSDRIYQDVPEGTGAKTNGADIRSLVACNAVVDRLEGIAEEDIPSGVPDWLAEELSKGLLSYFPQKSALLDAYLYDISITYTDLFPKVKGYGLIRGLEVRNKKGRKDNDLTKEIQRELLMKGVLVRHHGSTLIIKPPLVIKDKELEKGFKILKKVVKRYA